MATWDELFAEGKLIARVPEASVLTFASNLESAFTERPLRIWDLGCGAGRHTCALAARGYAVHGSDASPRGIEHTRALLAKHELRADLAVADMTAAPWPDVRFHGVVSLDAIHHNRLTEIRRAVAVVHDHLLPGGHFFATVKSSKADSYGQGVEVAPGTFIPRDGYEAGVPHHFFDEAGIRALLKGWELLVLVERVMDYRARGEDFLAVNPFGYTCWGILARKGERG